MEDHSYNKEIIDEILKDIHESRCYLERIADTTEKQKDISINIQTVIVVIIAWLIGLSFAIPFCIIK